MADAAALVAPKPVNSKHIMSMPKEIGGMGVSVPIPLSYMRFIPEYPTKEHSKPPISGMRGPFASTKRPNTGAEMWPPTECFRTGTYA